MNNQWPARPAEEIDLRKLYNYINTLVFDGKLPKRRVKIDWKEVRTNYFGFANFEHYTPAMAKWVGCRFSDWTTRKPYGYSIYITNSAAAHGYRWVVWTMIHEMRHIQDFQNKNWKSRHTRKFHMDVADGCRKFSEATGVKIPIMNI